jgi:hypothetical protein
MENIKLPASLLLIWDIRRALEKNQSLQIGIKFFLSRQLKCRFSHAFADLHRDQMLKTEKSENVSLSPDKFNVPQRALMFLIVKGLAGLPIYENIKLLEKEFVTHCEDDIQGHIMKLPLLLQIPMLGLLFPAIMCMLIVPALGMLRF